MKPPSDVDPGALAKTGPSGSGVVTLEQVARAAGVSPSTVSRILNGTAQVKAEKKEAVQRAIENLGFRPNPVARGLAGGRTLSVGVVTQTISSPFYGEALHGIEDRLQADGYIPIFVSGHWHEAEERKALEALLSRRVDGLIVLAGRLSQPRSCRPMRAACRWWWSVARSAARACSAWVRQPRGRVAGHPAPDRAAGTGASPTSRAILGTRRRAGPRTGYREALQEAGIAFDPALVLPGDYTETGGLAVNRLLDSA
jgi:LacI family transcriptional regulator